MIKLYGSGQNFGLPDASPFVAKAETLLRMSKLPFERRPMSFSRAPKKKIPYIEDDGVVLGDSTFIRWHLEQKYAIDFDAGLTAEQRATAWAFEKMAEDNLYWVLIDLRWMVDDNFDKGPRMFFNAVPAPIRPLVVAMVRRQVRKSLHYHGMGRHSRADIERLGTRSITAIADYLGEKPFFMGDRPTSVDATVFAFVSGALCPVFHSPVQQAAWSRGTLRRYVGRMTARFFPDYSQIAGCEAAA
ncbi:MAG: glutathione S-transferase family protein [Xanthobacteraceae bacterium]|nr:glutathione S-transferase family protein [Xanthobacteraceae bacterium]